ncbi:ABC transporter substrate-binding protein [Nocardioides alpinus]|nr:ABC transporter substrate-binding protein [Nocardioides alpinus]
MALGLASVSIGSASAAPESPSARSVVGKSDQGKITSTVTGKTSEGDKVTGSFTPTRFVQRDGVLYAKGFLEGKISNADGSTTKFSGIKKMPVKKINGQSVTSARTANRAAACDILNLVLGPLDLNVLGLQVSLQRVVLDIVAVAGAGQLLGNLLCAVAGLLDGGPLAALLGQLSTLLNQILAALNLGV